MNGGGGGEWLLLPSNLHNFALNSTPFSVLHLSRLPRSCCSNSRSSLESMILELLQSSAYNAMMFTLGRSLMNVMKNRSPNKEP